MLGKICHKFVKKFQNSDRDISHRGFVEIAKTPIDHRWRDKARISGQKIKQKSNRESKPLFNSDFKGWETMAHFLQ
jgi:hypothetical protein